MDTLLHTLRCWSRHLAGVLALVFALSSLLAMVPAQAKSESPKEVHTEHMHMMAHHAHHASAVTPAAPSSNHHHGSNACCLGALNCAQACDHSLTSLGAIVTANGGSISPSVHAPSVPVKRPLQPPRRPPKV